MTVHFSPQLLGIGAIAAALLAFAFFSWAMGTYNMLVGLRNEMNRAWSNIDILLKQFHDEIPMLVSICEQFVQYERSTIDHLLQARERYTRATQTEDKVAAGAAMTAAVQGVMAIGEAYPELHSNQQFMQIQSRISAIQDTLADRREFFNAMVTNYNVSIQQFPAVLIAEKFGFRSSGMFHVLDEERTAPSVRMKLPA